MLFSNVRNLRGSSRDQSVPSWWKYWPSGLILDIKSVTGPFEEMDRTNASIPCLTTYRTSEDHSDKYHAPHRYCHIPISKLYGVTLLWGPRHRSLPQGKISYILGTIGALLWEFLVENGHPQSAVETRDAVQNYHGVTAQFDASVLKDSEVGREVGPEFSFMVCVWKLMKLDEIFLGCSYLFLLRPQFKSGCSSCRTPIGWPVFFFKKKNLASTVGVIKRLQSPLSWGEAGTFQAQNQYRVDVDAALLDCIYLHSSTKSSMTAPRLKTLSQVDP